MPRFYPHNVKGWRITYRIYFLDGTDADKTRWAKGKGKAKDILADVGRLETLSRQNALTKAEIVYCLNRGYINHEEASKLTRSYISSATTWSELSKKYEDWSRANCRKMTHINNVSKLPAIIKRLMPKLPADLTEDDIQGYVRKRKLDGKKSATIRKEQGHIRKLLDFLGDENPARKVRLMKITDERIPRILERPEICCFMKALKNNRRFLRGYLRPATLTYLYAGLRPSEIVRLTPNDIRAGKIFVQGETKTGAARSVDIHPKLEPHVSACLRKGGEYIFGGDTPLLSNSLGRAIRMVIDEAKLEGITPYSLRHTFVTELLRAGADLRYVMDKAGHRRLSTTTRYLHSIESEDSPVRRIKFKK